MGQFAVCVQMSMLLVYIMCNSIRSGPMICVYMKCVQSPSITPLVALQECGCVPLYKLLHNSLFLNFRDSN